MASQTNDAKKYALCQFMGWKRSTGAANRESLPLAQGFEAPVQRIRGVFHVSDG